MPVRVAIHSSDVSTIFDNSSFVMTLLGTADPVPMIRAPAPTFLPRFPSVKSVTLAVSKANNGVDDVNNR